ncbi:MAG TPA: glycoside hydrolase family 88 protein [Cyclobacteriaceae bacterium]|nr:glycoside hydrolase family 88 protein [Cyclobacteriaceae bacterium]
MNRPSVLILLLFLILTGKNAHAQLSNWPSGTSPQEIGKKVSHRFLQSPHGVYGYGAKPHIPYFEVCTWYGALTFAKETRNKELSSMLEDRFTTLTEKEAHLYPKPDHVDYNVFGAMVLELYLQTQNKKYRDMGVAYADKQWDIPTDSALTDQAKQYVNDGYSWQTRLWIDDMYMISMVQSQAYRATGDKKYLERAAKEMVFYLNKLQQPNGLFYHAPDVPFFWGRGNGWMAAGMTELLRVLPTENPHYPRILESYKKMMNTLLSYQTESGAWRQLIDDDQAWKESSCTGMFTFALITGIKNGWLEKTQYEDAARKGWLAVVSFINENGDVTEVCEGTGKNNNHQYYLDRKRNVGDFHGQAPVLWCATALLRK